MPFLMSSRPCQNAALVPFLLFLMMMSPSLAAQAPADSVASGLYELANARVMFHSGTQIENFSGETDKAEGSLNTQTGRFEFRVDMASVETGNGRRDRNMREDYMETDTYPYVSYEGNIDNIPSPEEATTGQRVRSTGRFTLKDQTRDVEIDGTMRYRPETGTWLIEARFYILLSDYNIERPRFLFIRMQDEQEVELSFELRPAE